MWGTCRLSSPISHVINGFTVMVLMAAHAPGLPAHLALAAIGCNSWSFGCDTHQGDRVSGSETSISCICRVGSTSCVHSVSYPPDAVNQGVVLDRQSVAITERRLSQGTDIMRNETKTDGAHQEWQPERYINGQLHTYLKKNLWSGKAATIWFPRSAYSESDVAFIIVRSLKSPKTICPYNIWNTHI